MIGNLFVMAKRHNVVILNLFQDNTPPSPLVPNQVRDDENLFDHKPSRRG